MTISEEILTIANKLANEGKHPSIALVKTKLSNKVPLPVIITTLKNWQHEPERINLVDKNESEKVEKTVKGNDVELAAIIENALLPIKQELAEIKQLLYALKK